MAGTCDQCQRTNRALFTRLLSGNTRMILCDMCLRLEGSDLLYDLQSARSNSYYCRIRPQVQMLGVPNHLSPERSTKRSLRQGIRRSLGLGGCNGGAHHQALTEANCFTCPMPIGMPLWS
jgi:hypothetical protein